MAATAFLPPLLFLLLVIISSSPDLTFSHQISPSPSPSPHDHPSPSPLPITPPSPSPSPFNALSPPSPIAGDTETPSPCPSTQASPAPSPAKSEAVQRSSDVTADGDDGESEGMSGGKKAGIAVGVFAAAGLVGLGAVVYKKRQDNIRRSRYGYNERMMEMI